jgi:hypothetical protein
MIKARGHDASVTKKSAFSALDCPAAKAMLMICRDAAIELCVALASADRPSVVLHHLRVGVHGGEGVPVSFLPTSKLRARRPDYHGAVGPAISSIEEEIGLPASTLAQIMTAL